jgi:hypothetical protein
LRQEAAAHAIRRFTFLRPAPRTGGRS